MRRFTFFRPADEIDISRRRLPHWEQPNVCYFLTFRAIDSIPSGVMAGWKLERKQWLEAHGIDAEAEDWHSRLEELPQEVRQEVRQVFHEGFSKRMHAFLDTNVGECMLRRKDLRDVVANAFEFFDGTRYLLGGYVIMPNHVHVLVQCLGETRLKALCYSWKRFTARMIHKRVGRTGHFWQAETYDHIVRSEVQMEHYRRYIGQNPTKAGLKAGEYEVYLPEVTQDDC